MTIQTGIIGLGAIGNFIIDRINENHQFSISAVYDIDSSKYENLKNRIISPPPCLLVENFPQDTDVFIECASVKAVPNVLTETIKRNKTAIVASIGGITENLNILSGFEKSNARLLLPSGAIGGLDILKAIDPDEIIDITLTTRKNPDSLPDGLVDKNIESEIFCGNASDAISRFPKNINVAAILSLAGIGIYRTKVRIISDPMVNLNTHDITITANCGQYRIICQNKPFPDNLASSMLAAKSIWATLKSLHQNVSIGL